MRSQGIAGSQQTIQFPIPSFEVLFRGVEQVSSIQTISWWRSLYSQDTPLLVGPVFTESQEDGEENIE